MPGRFGGTTARVVTCAIHGMPLANESRIWTWLEWMECFNGWVTRLPI